MKRLPLLLALLSLLAGCQLFERAENKRPNILLVISDDQSYPHASAYGESWIETPAFDRIAGEGVLCHQAFAASPGCSPSRAALLTGRHTWQIEAAGTHASDFPAKYPAYPDLLAATGYAIGHTGKGWGPGNWQDNGWPHNPAGPTWNELEHESTPEGIRRTDYAANFAAFLESREADQPFCFWYGASEPHRVFGEGLGQAAGKALADATVPTFLPDDSLVRSDLLDYAFEIEWFDQHLGRMIELLEEKGELENTLIIVTSDNGMAFPRAKANVYEYGIHVPMAIRWGSQIPGGQVSQDLIGFVDLAPTILAAAGVEPPTQFPYSGRNLLPQLKGEAEAAPQAVYAARERHSSSRYLSLSYPQRALRTPDFLYIRNFEPKRWPAGAPQKYGTGSYAEVEQVKNQELGPMHAAYHDIDACPTMDWMVAQREVPAVGKLLQAAVAFRPAEELYDIRQDPACLNNLATDPNHANVLAQLRDQLMAYLRETGDPRALGRGDIWETYPRHSAVRFFPAPDWAIAYPDSVPEVPWLEEREREMGLE